MLGVPPTTLWTSSMMRIWSRPWSRKMRKALDELEEEGRNALLYLADLGTAVCMSGLVVSVLKFIGDLF